MLRATTHTLPAPHPFCCSTSYLYFSPIPHSPHSPHSIRINHILQIIFACLPPAPTHMQTQRNMTHIFCACFNYGAKFCFGSDPQQKQQQQQQAASGSNSIHNDNTNKTHTTHTCGICWRCGIKNYWLPRSIQSFSWLPAAPLSLSLFLPFFSSQYPFLPIRLFRCLCLSVFALALIELNFSTSNLKLIELSWGFPIWLAGAERQAHKQVNNDPFAEQLSRYNFRRLFSILGNRKL